MSTQTRRKFLGMAAISFAAAASCTSREAPDPARNKLPTIRSDADVEALLPALSNWGRWGEADRLGTLNFITAERRAQAAREVQSGESVSLARTTTIQNVDHGVLEMDIRAGAALDIIAMRYHGYEMTHLDALGHVFADELHMYNKLPRTLVTEAGVQELGAEIIAATGIAGRGVLLDIAALKNGPLKPGTAIFPAELEAAERRQRVTVSSGDILFVRTGSGRSNTWQVRAGLHPDCLPWIHERQVAALGSDGDSDVAPLAGFEKWQRVLHSVGIPYLGLPLIDNAELDALAVACASARRWSFMVTVAPLRIAGLTGSPVNPVAVL